MTRAQLLKFASRTFVFFIIVAAVLSLVYHLFLKRPNTLMVFDDPWGQERPLVEVKEHGVVAGTPWATEVAIAVLEQGGNAYDAAVAGLFMLYVTHGEASAFPGIAPAMVYDSSTGLIEGYVGVGTAPELATIERFQESGYETVPPMDIYAQLVPAGPDTVIALLEKHGTMSFEALVQPAIKRALEGFPIHEVMYFNLNLPLYKRLGFDFLLPYNSEVYFDKKPWKPLYKKERFRRPDLAKLFTALLEAEKQAIAKGESRSGALQAVRKTFYDGDISNQIAKLHNDQKGLMRESDLNRYHGHWETPQVGRFGEYEVHVNGAWSQGMALPMALNILQGAQLESMERNSGDYIHTVSQAIELAMADREAYLGDPVFVDVPATELLGNSYGESRRASFSDTAFKAFPLPLAIDGYKPYIGSYPETGARETSIVGDDTSQIIVVDKYDNLVAITPSDFPMTPMVPGWDITLGNRMTQFRLDEGHPAALEPGKRPRVTPQAVMIKKSGEFYMAINTPGGDNQVQAMLQVLLNHIIFGDDIQTAIERPRFMTLGFPSSFAPHTMKLSTLEVEAPIDNSVINHLVSKGYSVEKKERWMIAAGVGAIVKTNNGYVIGSDPRAETVASGR